MARNLFTSLLVLVGYSLSAQNAAPMPAKFTTDFTEIGSPLPPFMATTLDPVPGKPGRTKVITDKDVKNDANLFVMIFNPVCEHCEDETFMIEKNIGLFKKSKIVLICNKMQRQYLNNFLLITHNKDYPMIKIGVDSTDYIKKTLTYDQIPQINIYDHNRKLLRVFSGGAPVDSFARYIE